MIFPKELDGFFDYNRFDLFRNLGVFDQFNRVCLNTYLNLVIKVFIYDFRYYRLMFQFQFISDLIFVLTQKDIRKLFLFADCNYFRFFRGSLILLMLILDCSAFIMMRFYPWINVVFLLLYR